MFAMQFLGQGDWLGTLISFIFIFILIIFGPRLMIAQTIWRLEKDVAELETMAAKARRLTIKRFIKQPSRALNEKIKNFMDFFVALPVSTDPYGIIKKMDAVLRHGNRRHRRFVDSIAPNLSKIEKMDLDASLSHSSGIQQIAKIMRHYLETIKKYKIFQLAMLLQMQFPLIKRIAVALYDSVEAFTKSLPIGDGVGPMVVASFIPSERNISRLESEEFVYYKTKIEGRDVIFSKADGPGTSIGHPGRFVEYITGKEKITRIISIDAAAGLEGERPGSIAEGVGFGMRGSNPVDSFEIEEIAVKKGILLDSIAIKQIGEQALQPMRKEVLDSVPKVAAKLKEMIADCGKNEKILVIGLGNTCGIGNHKKSVESAILKLKKYHKKKAEKRKKKKKRF